MEENKMGKVERLQEAASIIDSVDDEMIEEYGDDGNWYHGATSMMELRSALDSYVRAIAYCENQASEETEDVITLTSQNKMYGDMMEIPKEEVAELARWRGMECGNIRNSLPDDVSMDTKTWKLLRGATPTNIGRTHDDKTEVFFEASFNRARLVASSTRHHPAEYENEEHVAIIRVEMELGDPEAGVEVEVEVERQ